METCPSFLWQDETGGTPLPEEAKEGPGGGDTRALPGWENLQVIEERPLGWKRDVDYDNPLRSYGDSAIYSAFLLDIFRSWKRQGRRWPGIRDAE